MTRSLLSNLKPLQESIQVKIGDSTLLEATSTGNVYLCALFVPKLSFNLFSTMVVFVKGYTSRTDADKSEIFEHGKPVIVAERNGGLFRMKFERKVEQALSAVSIKTWHERLAHQNVRYVRDILKKNNISYVDEWNGYVCEGCIYGKQCQLSHQANTVTAK